jgi:hypothetical protein
MAVAIAQSQVSTIDHVSKTGAENSLVVAIDASRPVMPKAPAVERAGSNSHRFPRCCAVQTVARHTTSWSLRSVRIAQFSAEPFVTRVVLDLKFMQKYEISSIGNKVVVRVNLEQVPSQSNDAEPKQ